MLCPLWSIFYEKEAECILHRGMKCGMSLLCGLSGEEFQRLDECPKGHKTITEVTSAADLPNHVFMCLEEGCNERWSIDAEGRMEKLEG